MASLADRISELINPAPKFLDKDDDDFDAAVCTDKNVGDYGDIQVTRSQLRIQNFQPCLDKRYAGEKVSRRKLMHGSDESDNELASIDEDNDKVTFEENNLPHSYSKVLEQYVDEDDSSLNESTDEDDADGENLVKEGGSDSSEVESSGDEAEENTDKEDDDEDMIQKFSNIDMEEEMKKGKAVKAQLSLWDQLLENRIKLQKLLVISNKLPQNDDWKQFFERGNDEFRKSVHKGNKSVKLLLELLLELQTELLRRNNNTNYIICNKDNPVKEGSDEEIPSDTEDEDTGLTDKGIKCSVKRKLSVDEYPEFLAKRHKSFASFRNGTIQKWNDKTRIASGKLSQNAFKAFDQSALKQIEQILSDKPRLIKRTQLKRSVYRTLGKKEESKEVESFETGKEVVTTRNNNLKDYDSEIFDDDDFYHQLLRELIERKTMDTNDPIALSRHWLEIQRQRTKMKKNVDTKASKGRKVRYDGIRKLVNFMASMDHRTTSDETLNELCRSLFKDGHQATLFT